LSVGLCHIQTIITQIEEKEEGMTYEIRRIDIWSVVKIAFILCGIFGLFAGLLYAIMLTMVGGFLSQMGGEFGNLQSVTGVVGIFVAFFLALFYAVIGAVGTAIFAWIYNLLAKGLGGVKFHLEQEKVQTVTEPIPRTESESEGMAGRQRYE
jgi:hypothetical protein